MFSFIATILSLKFISEHLAEFCIGLVVFIGLIIFLVARSRKRRAAYLALPIIYVGNKSTRTYHLQSCTTLKNVNPNNLVAFRTSQEVARSGYKPCAKCILNK